MTLFDHGLGGPAERVPVDHEARERVRNDVTHNLFVEAGAGTGKTKVLVDRVVRLVSSGTVREPAGLVAITFTEAAAAELRDRIRSELERAAANEALPADERARCRTTRDRLDEAVITTLHGFAQRVLAEHPLEAGLPPSFEVDDGVASRVRFVERWNAFCDDLFDDPTAEADLLLGHALGLGTGRLRDVAQRFHDRWDRVLEADLLVPTVPRVDLEPIVAPLREAILVAGDRLVSDDILANIVRQWASVALLLDQAISAGDELEAIRTLASAPLRQPGGYGKKPLWGDDKPVIAELGTRARDASIAVLEQLRRAVLERMLPRLRDFTAAGVEERRSRGRLEFHDLLVHARNLLRADAGVRAGLASRIDVILIDEFQDTDPIQLDIAFLLAAADPSAPPAPWAEAELAPGKLLIVGDPKQSIYGFRGADISLWDRTRSRFGPDVVRLDQNFRTVPQLLAWVNEVFAEVIAEGEEGMQPSFDRLAAFRPDLREGPAVMIVGGPVDQLPVAELREREASDLAELIVSLRADGVTVSPPEGPEGAPPRPLRFDDIALLVPTRTPLAQLERALDRHDIPSRVESRSLIWATDAVRELLAVLAAIDDPADEVALIAALRSPGFACSDVDLLEWREAGGWWDHRGEPPEGLDPDHPVARAMAALHTLHRDRGTVPVNELVERVVRERGLVELTFAQRRPRDHWRRLRFVVDQARAFVEGGGRSVGEFVAWAELQMDEGAQVVETPAPEPDDDAVRILTIHGSKGLEFPVVVLAGLASSGRDNGPWVRWGDERPEVAVGPKGSRFATTGFAAAAETASEAADYEDQRLLYVAATRARDHLVVSLHHSMKGQGTHAKELWRVCQLAAVFGTWEPAEIPEQLVLPVAVPDSGPAPATLDARATWLASHEALVASTWAPRVLSATALAGLGAEPVEAPPNDDSVPTPSPTSFRRGGTAVGRAVHAVLQTVDLDDPGDLAAMAGVHAAVEGMADAAEQVAHLAASALASPVVLEARASTRRWREVAVVAPIADGRYVEGYLDLLFEDANGDLVVVDYKTDRARTDAELDAAMGRYRLQAAAYALALEATLGRPVARAVFVFTRSDTAVEREVTDLPTAVAEARTLVTTA
ncbi:MAG: ATP-dependent helicase/nuclease subunit [Acidimicrobiaceae bacterium]